MRKHGRLELCLVLPDGSKSLIPAAWTDIDPGAEPASGPETLGSLADLLHARAVVDGLIHRAEAAGSEDAGQPTEEVPHAADRCRWPGWPRHRRSPGSSSLPTSRPRRSRCWPG